MIWMNVCIENDMNIQIWFWYDQISEYIGVKKTVQTNFTKFVSKKLVQMNVRIKIHDCDGRGYFYLTVNFGTILTFL